VRSAAAAAAAAPASAGGCESDALARADEHVATVRVTIAGMRADGTAGGQVNGHSGLGVSEIKQLERALVRSLESAGGPW
jgi:hypothetical protein